MAVWTLLGLVTIMTVGLLTVEILAGKNSSFSLRELASLAFGAGIGVVSLGMFYLAYWNIQLSRGNVAMLAIGLVLGTLVLWTRIWGSAVPWRLNPHWHIRGRHSSKLRLEKTEICLLGLIGFLVLLVFVDACSEPLLSFDARAIWAFKAKVLYSEQNIYSAVFLDGGRLHAKTRYPQLIPLAETFISHSAGRFEEKAFKTLFPMYFVSLLLLVYLMLRAQFSRSFCLVAVSLFGSMPVFVIYANGGVASGYADLPLAFYVTALAICLFRWLEKDSVSALRLAALFGMLTVFTKNEGLALLGVSLFATGLMAHFVFRKPFRKMWGLLLLPLAVLGPLSPWLHYQAQLPVVDEDFVRLLTLQNLTAGVARLPFIVRSFVKEFFFKPHLWNLLGLFSLFAVGLSGRKVLSSRVSFFLWVPVLYTIQLCGVFLVIPWRLEDLFPVALSRLTMHTTPLLFLWVCFQVGNSGVLPSVRLVHGPKSPGVV
jgi:hypothetical protein